MHLMPSLCFEIEFLKVEIVVLAHMCKFLRYLYSYLRIG